MLKLFSEKINRLSVFTPNLWALIFIWDCDSSPDMYNTFLSEQATFLDTCIRSVDFPIPGSPPTKTKEPLTIPPPNTLSNSSIPVVNLSNETYTIQPDERVAQMIIARVEQAKIEVVTELTATARGAGGFGSTGKS